MIDLRHQELSYSLRRYYIDTFFFRHIPTIPAGECILDIGGTKILKRGLFDIEHYDVRVIYLNVSSAKCPDVKGDAVSLPFKDQCFDAVICAELFEHLRNPLETLQEAYRVLRPGGKIFVTVPFLFRIHPDPCDFGRYTDYFWQISLEDIGFRNILLERQGYFFSVLVDFGRQYLSQIGVRRPFGRAARWCLLAFQAWALAQERQPEVAKNAFLQSFTIGFGIVARK